MIGEALDADSQTGSASTIGSNFILALFIKFAVILLIGLCRSFIFLSAIVPFTYSLYIMTKLTCRLCWAGRVHMIAFGYSISFFPLPLLVEHKVLRDNISEFNICHYRSILWLPNPIVVGFSRITFSDRVNKSKLSHHPLFSFHGVFEWQWVRPVMI